MSKNFSIDELSEQFDYELNNNMKPEEFSYELNKKINWKCNICDHRWSATIRDRVNDNGCPNCYKNQQN